MNFIAIVATTIMMVIPATCMAYTPPIGIPDPGFGIDDIRPTRPAEWTSEVAGYYYINNATGTNTGRTYGTPTAPRQSFPSPIPAGSYVEVHGTYTDSNNIILTGNGTSATWAAGSAGPVWIVGASSEEKPVFTRKVVVTGSYIYFDTVKFYAPGLFQASSPTTGYPADHIVLRNSEVEGSVANPGPAVAVGGASTSKATNVVIYNNTLHHTGDITITSDQDSHITTVDNYSENVWFLENTMHTGSGSGAQVGGPSSGYDNCHHVYYGRNHVYNTRAAGLAVKYASDVIFSQNHLHDLIDTRTLYSESASPSKGVGFQYAPNRVWILFNHIYNASYGIYGGSTNTPPPDWYIYAIGNVIHDIYPPSTGLMSAYSYNPENSWSESGIMMAGGSYRYIINNTIYSAVGGIYCPSSDAYYMANNIVSKVTHEGGYHIFMDSGTGAGASYAKNMIVHQPDGTEKIRWSSSHIGTLSNVVASSGTFINSSASDPLFVDTDTDDYHITIGSPGVDGGLVEEAYNTFYTTYGLDIKKDISGTTRPSGVSWDIGAYEYTAASPAARSLFRNVRLHTEVEP